MEGDETDMYIMIHKEALGSVVGAFLVLIFTLYSVTYMRTLQSPLMLFDYLLVQAALLTYLLGYTAYLSAIKPPSPPFWAQVSYSGMALLVGSIFRFYESLKEKPHGWECGILEGVTLLLIGLIVRQNYRSFAFLLIVSFSYVLIRTNLYIIRDRDKWKMNQPIFYGFLVLFAVTLYNSVSFLRHSSLPPQSWLGPVGLSLGFTAYSTGMARRHQEELEEIRWEKDQIYHNLIHDKLTGLYTRDYLLENLHQLNSKINRNDTPCSLTFLDLDNFKLLNDELGHIAGDTLLRELGACLKERTRNYDIAARLGGDEFILLLPDSSPERAEIISTNIMDYLKEIMENNFPDWPLKNNVSLSIGIVGRKNWSPDPEILIKRADKAMYNSKRLGKNCISHYGEIAHAE